MAREWNPTPTEWTSPGLQRSELRLRVRRTRSSHSYSASSAPPPQTWSELWLLRSDSVTSASHTVNLKSLRPCESCLRRRELRLQPGVNSPPTDWTRLWGTPTRNELRLPAGRVRRSRLPAPVAPLPTEWTKHWTWLRLRPTWSEGRLGDRLGLSELHRALPRRRAGIWNLQVGTPWFHIWFHCILHDTWIHIWIHESRTWNAPSEFINLNSCVNSYHEFIYDFKYMMPQLLLLYEEYSEIIDQLSSLSALLSSAFISKVPIMISHLLILGEWLWKSICESSSAKWGVNVNAKYVTYGLLHMLLIKLHISAYFHCIFEHIWLIQSILLHIFCIIGHTCIFLAYICILPAYLSIFLAYFVLVFYIFD